MGLNCPRCGFKPDYIPRGGPTAGVVRVRDPNRNDPQQCGAPVSNDPQSGPIYCGDLVTKVGDCVEDDGRVVAVCKRHEGRLQKMLVVMDTL